MDEVGPASACRADRICRMDRRRSIETSHVYTVARRQVRRRCATRVRPGFSPSPFQLAFNVCIDVGYQLVRFVTSEPREYFGIPFSRRFPITIGRSRADSAKACLVGTVRSFARGGQPVAAFHFHDGAAFVVCGPIHDPPVTSDRHERDCRTSRHSTSNRATAGLYRLAPLRRGFSVAPTLVVSRCGPSQTGRTFGNGAPPGTDSGPVPPLYDYLVLLEVV